MIYNVICYSGDSYNTLTRRTVEARDEHEALAKADPRQLDGTLAEVLLVEPLYKELPRNA